MAIEGDTEASEYWEGVVPECFVHPTVKKKK